MVLRIQLLSMKHFKPNMTLIYKGLYSSFQPIFCLLFIDIILTIHRAIEESLLEYSRFHVADEEPASADSPSYGQQALDEDIQLAISLSRQELEQYQQRRREEEDMLERVLKLSMTEK